MSAQHRFGVIAEYNNRRISIFDTDTLQLIQQIPLNADVIDVDISRDGRFAVVSSFSSKTMFTIRLWPWPAEVAGSAVSPSLLEDVQLTPDNRFAFSVDGSAANQDIVSYSPRTHSFVSMQPTSAQAIAISPITSLTVLTAEYFTDQVRRFTYDAAGILTDTGVEVAAGSSPINLLFSPDGVFAFVANTPTGITVLSTLNPNNIITVSTAATTSQPQSMAVTRDGRHLFVLGRTNVDIYAFDAVAGSLTLENSFAHNLGINSYFGVDQIALDADETRLFISAQGQVAVFATYGLPLGTVAGAAGPGGLDLCCNMC